MPQTKKALQEAAEELTTLAAQLEKGQLHNARYLDAAIAKASHALAEWHYFKAKDYLGQDDAKRAARHLQTAAQYLRAAADSANHEYGSEMMPVFESIDLYGNMIEEDIVEPKLVSKDLTVIEQEINRMAERLKSASK